MDVVKSENLIPGGSSAGISFSGCFEKSSIVFELNEWILFAPIIVVLIELGTQDGEHDSTFILCIVGVVVDSFLNSLLKVWSDVLLSELVSTAS
jgi:hypothetical protein